MLYSFNNIPDAGVPGSAVVFDRAGNLYGNNPNLAETGDCSNGIDPKLRLRGAVYKLTYSCAGWTETVIYSFQGNGNDGFTPRGGLIFDAAGNLYGTTWTGGQLQLRDDLRIDSVGRWLDENLILHISNAAKEVVHGETCYC